MTREEFEAFLPPEARARVAYIDQFPWASAERGKQVGYVVRGRSGAVYWLYDTTCPGIFSPRTRRTRCVHPDGYHEMAPYEHLLALAIGLLVDDAALMSVAGKMNQRLEGFGQQ